jgi:hypothetical protein
VDSNREAAADDHAPDPEDSFGVAAWREFWKTWRDAWETVTIRVERIEDLGDDVLAFRDGLAARIDVLDPQEALEAAGLRSNGTAI